VDTGRFAPGNLATVITSVTHDPRVSPFRDKNVFLPVHIEDNVWIGAGAVILPGVRIGRGSIVAAGAVVREDVPPGALVAGVPAKVKRSSSTASGERALGC